MGLGLGLGLSPWVAVFFFLGVDGRLWVASGGGVRCVVQWWWACGDGGFSKFVVVVE